ncbi:MAG TPA: RNA polymerase sigma factor [Acidimicrobiales bacterium]|nr:RNA polymerase sigma factor [Acidimicrobiales bacterium]
MADGNREALDLLYRRHAGWLTARLQRRCPDPDVVDTAVQEAFLAAWRGAGRWKPSGEFGAWLWTVGLRRLIDQIRRQQRHGRDVSWEVVGSEPVDSGELPLALTDTRVGSELSRLAPELQAVMVATAVEGLSTGETAILLGIPRGTVKSRMSRARKLLRTAISEGEQ